MYEYLHDFKKNEFICEKKWMNNPNLPQTLYSYIASV